MSKQPSTMKRSREHRHAVVGAVCRLLEDRYVFPTVADQAAAHVLARANEGAYDLPDAAFADVLTRDLQAITADTHLRVVYDPGRVAQMRKDGLQGGGPDASALARSCNHGFASVRHLKGNVGTVDIRHFFSPSISGDTAAAAMRFIADSDAVIVDLRNNTGGNPGMVQFLCSYFVGGSTPVHLNSMTSRPLRTTTEYWTLPDVPGKRMLDTPLYVLTSAHTFSGGEEFAYNMAALKRGTIIGETTAGGANAAGINIVSDDYYAAIPHATPTNPITGDNWESCGVAPHIQTCAADALEIAHTQALTRLVERASAEPARAKLEWLLEEVVSSYHPMQLPASVLERYVGRYDDTEVFLEQDTLVYQRRFFRYRLNPLSESRFWLDGPAAGFESRVEFAGTESGAITQLVGRYPDGRTVTFLRQG